MWALWLSALVVLGRLVRRGEDRDRGGLRGSVLDVDLRLVREVGGHWALDLVRREGGSSRPLS